MKKVIHSHVVWTVFAAILLLIGLYIAGFRVTYAPNLENSWDAISAFASWSSVFVSGLAIYYAILVPKKIAEDQNKIALFEKRYEVYKTLTDCFAFAFMLENTDVPDNQCLEIFHIVFNENAKLNDNTTKLDRMRTYSEVQNKLKMAEHLFDTEIAGEIALLLANLLLLIQTEENDTDVKKRQRVYIEQSKKVESTCELQIKGLLALK